MWSEVCKSHIARLLDCHGNSITPGDMFVLAGLVRSRRRACRMSGNQRAIFSHWNWTWRPRESSPIHRRCKCTPMAAGFQVPGMNSLDGVCRVSGESTSSQCSGALAEGGSEEAAMDWFVDWISEDYEPGDCRATTETRELKVCTPNLHELRSGAASLLRSLNTMFRLRQRDNPTLAWCCMCTLVFQAGKRLGRRHLRMLLTAVGRDCLEGTNNTREKVRRKSSW